MTYERGWNPSGPRFFVDNRHLHVDDYETEAAPTLCAIKSQDGPTDDVWYIRAVRFDADD